MTETPELYAIVGGVSDYAGDQLDLRYAAKDAEEFAHALELGAAALLGKERVHIKLLTTGSTRPARHARRPKRTFARPSKSAAKPNRRTSWWSTWPARRDTATGQRPLSLPDSGGGSSDDAALSDEKVRENVSISSEELMAWTSAKKIKALKQVMILDTCAAGRQHRA